MLKNQKGFTLIEGLLVFIALAFIGGIGYYVYTQQTTNDTNKSTTTTETTDKAEEEAVDTQKESNIPEGWKEYTNNNPEFRFAYPDNYKLSGEATVENDGFDISITSPDYDFDTSGPIGNLKAGTAFNVSLTENKLGVDNANEYLNYLKQDGNSDYHGNMKLATIGTTKVYTADCGHNNPFYCVYFVTPDYLYGFEYEYPRGDEFRSNKSVDLDTFNQLLETVEIN